MKKILHKIFDPSLTPGSAALKGYEYLDDILVSLQTTKQSTIMFLKLLAKHRLKLGVPSHINEGYFGLYVPYEEIEKLVKMSI